MTYLPVHSRHPGRRIIIGAIVGAVVLLAILDFFVPYFLPAVAMSFARPFWRMEFSVLSGSLHSPDALLRENESLKRQVTEMQANAASVDAVMAENVELKALLGRASTTQLTLAAVLSRPPRLAYDELIIDVGTDQHIAVGDKVLAPGTILIGRVLDVYSQTARVRLFSSPGSSYDVQVGPSHIPATAHGRGGGQYEAALPRDAKVQEGDFVNSPSLNEKAFGIVRTVESDPTQPFETVLFAPPVNIYSLRWVLVDTRHTDEASK